MMADEPRQRLGRGLAALLGDAAPDADVRQPAPAPRQAPIELVRPNSRNPRKMFDDAALDELAASIRERGIIQPIVVRKDNSDGYEIIAGERRWRAAQRAGLHHVPVHVIEADDKTVRELAIIENVQRADLNPVEEATGYEQLMSDYGYTQNDLAHVIGKSRSHVANTLRLIKLPEAAKKLLAEGVLTAGHARALLAFPDPEAMAQRAVAQGMTVRDLERLAQQPADAKKQSNKPEKIKDADTKRIERDLGAATGLKVTITPASAETGQVTLKYASLDQLDGIIERLRQGLTLAGRD